MNDTTALGSLSATITALLGAHQRVYQTQRKKREVRSE